MNAPWWWHDEDPRCRRYGSGRTLRQRQVAVHLAPDDVPRARLQGELIVDVGLGEAGGLLEVAAPPADLIDPAGLGVHGVALRPAAEFVGLGVLQSKEEDCRRDLAGVRHRDLRRERAGLAAAATPKDLMVGQ